ncbi:MAG: hypothetical protein IKL08_06885 [Clostridia bacterium]|nr:hypothetical protein [Clostridia bacterium]
MLKNENINIINARYIKPIDKVILKELAKENHKIYVYESNIKTNSLGTNILEYFNHLQATNKVRITGIDNAFVEHGKISELKKIVNLDLETVVEEIKEFFKEEK